MSLFWLVSGEWGQTISLSVKATIRAKAEKIFMGCQTKLLENTFADAFKKSYA